MSSTEMRVVGGVKTRVLRAGKGEPVLLLHGLGASAYSWRYFLPALAGRYELFAPDFPGFGRSEKPWDFDYSIAGLHRWLLAFMDEYGIARARVVGNSMGGCIALWTAMDAPARVERLALLGTPAYPENRPKFLWPLSWPVVGSLLERALGETGLRYVVDTTFVDKSRITEELIAEYLEPLRSAEGRRAVAEVIRRALPPDWRARVARYGEIRHPALVLRGDSDGMVDDLGARRLARELGNARLSVIERCGHAPQEDAPERVIPVVQEFLA